MLRKVLIDLHAVHTRVGEKYKMLRKGLIDVRGVLSVQYKRNTVQYKRNIRC